MRIELPRDRDRCGRLSLIDDRSRVIFGPVWCAGRASDGAASGYGNDGRSYLLPYGDTPPGGYKIKKFISMRGASPRAVMQFGRFGVISLAAIDGPGVIADSVGRFEIWIHGGSRDPHGRLRPTNGSLRLADEDVFRLINLVKGHEGLRVEVREANGEPDAPPVGLDAETFDEGDPPTLEHVRLPPRQSLAPFPSTARPAPLHMIFMGEYDSGTTGQPDQSDEGLDYDFLSQQEGQQQLDAYTLDAMQYPKAGVTVGTGVDLGQTDEDGLKALGLSDELQEKLTPYLSLKGQDAVDYLEEHPLQLTSEEADELDRAKINQISGELSTSFNEDSSTKFSDLPSEAQTVITDVAYQYGSGLSSATPNFWKQVTEGRWQDAVDNLRDFGDQYGTRRNAEADRLQQAIDDGKLPKGPPTQTKP